MKQPKEKVPFPNRLTLYRRRCGYTLEDAATIMDIPADTVNKWEKGILAPGISDYFGLAHLYKVEPLKLYAPYVKQLEVALKKRVKELLGNRKR